MKTTNPFFYLFESKMILNELRDKISESELSEKEREAELEL